MMRVHPEAGGGVARVHGGGVARLDLARGAAAFSSSDTSSPRFLSWIESSVLLACSPPMTAIEADGQA